MVVEMQLDGADCTTNLKFGCLENPCRCTAYFNDVIVRVSSKCRYSTNQLSQAFLLLTVVLEALNVAAKLTVTISVKAIYSRRKRLR
jgi:hypothetical protein